MINHTFSFNSDRIKIEDSLGTCIALEEAFMGIVGLGSKTVSSLKQKFLILLGKQSIFSAGRL